MNTPERDKIIEALRKWISQRPGLDFCNYGDIRAYRSELRAITRDLHQARELLTYVASHPALIDTNLLTAAFRAYSGRLSWDGHRLTYCTGQYWPTEYRRAACAVLAQAIWDAWRANAPMRQKARSEFGRAIRRRWFD